ncbi:MULTISPECIES: substrate-binding domain-containing protein [Spirosoma]|nr:MULTISPECIES: substrate-binding domain-containing protein [Spirosoma]
MTNFRHWPILAMLFTPGLLAAQTPTDTLHVYGPGGPFGPLNECAALFGQQTGHPVKVVAGPDVVWLADAQQRADLFFGGSEYMLTQFTAAHPDLVDAASRTELYRRAAAILVRPGNPKQIKTLRDLTKPGITILDVNGAGQLGLWEDLAGRQNLIGGIQANIGQSFANSALGIAAWKQDSRYDAWITYASWHNRLTTETAVVSLPPSEVVFRGTPIALSKTTRQADTARQFVQFLQSDKGHAVFKKWGWD